MTSWSLVDRISVLNLLFFFFSVDVKTSKFAYGCVFLVFRERFYSSKRTNSTVNISGTNRVGKALQ